MNFYAKYLAVKKYWPSPKVLLMMKLTVLCMFLALMQVSAGGFAQKINLNERNASLTRVLESIKKQTGYVFVYEDADLDQIKITVQVKEASIDEALTASLKNQDLSYKILEKTVLIRKKETSIIDRVMGFFTAMDVKGTVLDEKKKPLPGVSILVKGSKHAAVTNGTGEFLLRSVPEKSVLVFSCVGYVTKEIAAVSDLGEIILETQTAKLTEVEIVSKGYYQTTREMNTGSISKVDAKTMEKQPVLNLLGTIQGRMPGVYVQQTTGIPGGDFNIEIRGRNSLRLEGNNPLYVIDGVPFSSEKVSSPIITGGILGSGASPLAGINNADIESIEILKDADATAIYGSRGSNGVVLITTKKGKAGKTKLSLDVYSGGGKAPVIDLLKTSDYLAMRREAFANDGLTPSSNPGSDYYAPDLTLWDQNRYTDWQKILIGGTAVSTSVQASLAGGSEGTQFIFSTGYRRETTVFPADFAFTKGSSHFSLNHRSPNKKLTLNLALSGTADQNNNTQIDLVNTSRKLAPNAPALYQADGSLNWENSSFENPLAKLNRKYNGNTSTFISNAVIGYEFLPGLQLKSSFGFTQVQSREKLLLPLSETIDPAQGLTSKSSVVNDGRGTNNSWIIEPQLSYERSVGSGDLSVLLGGSLQHQDFERNTDQYSDFPSNALLNNLSAAAEKTNREYLKTMYKYAAVFGRINYSIAKKYILNLTGRRDGSSRFGPGRQFANFGAAGVAWIFSKENWVEEHLPFLSFGKLRASYGAAGNDQIPDYYYLNTYSTPDGINQYDGITALIPSRLYNPDFAWEVNKKLEGAIDLGFLKDRINLTAGYYRNRSGNQLVNYTLPFTTGYNGILSNFPATVQNTGLEVELNTKNVQQKNFRWTSAFNITVPENKLLSFPNIESSTYNNTYIVGESIYIKKFYEYTGIDPQTGLYTFKDYNNDGIIKTPDDRRKARVIGQRFFGGLDNSFSYKNWSLDIFIQFVKQEGYNYWFNGAAPGLDVNMPQYILDKSRWQRPGDSPELQRFFASLSGPAATAFDSYRFSDGTITDASFVRCKNISLSYNLPKQWLKDVNGRVYVQAQNLFTLTRYEGYDPESQDTRLGPLKMLTAGLQVSF